MCKMNFRGMFLLSFPFIYNSCLQDHTVTHTPRLFIFIFISVENPGNLMYVFVFYNSVHRVIAMNEFLPTRGETSLKKNTDEFYIMLNMGAMTTRSYTLWLIEESVSML